MELVDNENGGYVLAGKLRKMYITVTSVENVGNAVFSDMVTGA